MDKYSLYKKKIIFSHFFMEINSFNNRLREPSLNVQYQSKRLTIRHSALAATIRESNPIENKHERHNLRKDGSHFNNENHSFSFGVFHLTTLPDILYTTAN